MKGILLAAVILAISSCAGQERLDATLIFDSKTRNDVVISLKKMDSLYFSNKYNWFAYKNISLWYIDLRGIKFSYNYDDSRLQRVNGMFENEKRILRQHEFSGKTEFDFYFDKSTIAWITTPDSMNLQSLRLVDIEKNIDKEVTFNVPESFLDLQPIIISSTKLLYGRYILNEDNTIDTLKIADNVWLPHFDRVYMRKNGFIVDRYYGEESPVLREDVNPIDYFKIEDDKLTVQNINPSNVKISNYRVETNHESIWLFSHKIRPEKFLMYDINTGKAYPFELDKSIFKLDNLYLMELEPDIDFTYDVKFSYHTSMTEDNIYIYMIKDGIKLYRVSDYRKLLR